MQTMIKPEIGSILADVLGQVRQEISSICDSEGDLIQADEVEGAISHLLTMHLQDCRFRDEIQEWLDTLRFGKE
jgi:hypothetical protein